MLRGPHARHDARAAPRGRACAAWSSCWLLRGSRPWSGTHECACLRLCRGPRAARSSGVSRLLVFSAPRRRASPPSRPDAGSGVVRVSPRRAPMPVGRCRFRRRCRRRGLRSRSGLTARRSRSRKILLTQILYDRYSPRYSTSESYMCTTYCAHVSRNRRPLASPLPVARAQASAAQELPKSDCANLHRHPCGHPLLSRAARDYSRCG